MLATKQFSLATNRQASAAGLKFTATLLLGCWFAGFFHSAYYAWKQQTEYFISSLQINTVCGRERTEKHPGCCLARAFWEGRDQSGQAGHVSKKHEAEGPPGSRILAFTVSAVR